MFLLRCPQCKHDMKYQPMGSSPYLNKKTKRCVYCGRTFIAKDHIIREL